MHDMRRLPQSSFPDLTGWAAAKEKSWIGIIALNSIANEGVIAKARRDPTSVSLDALRKKAKVLPHAEFRKYRFKFQSLSLDDM